MKVGIAFHRYGAYHICRINSLSAHFDTVGFELSSETKEYKWDKVRSDDAFKRVTIFETGDSRDAPIPVLKKEIVRHLDENPVDVLFINGWADKGALVMLDWCLRHNKKAILMTESTEIDFKRTPVKEWIKRRIVGLFEAAIVGGEPHARYARSLGVPGDRIVKGYDVVDNHYFRKQADQARENDGAIRRKHGLPSAYILASNRFIEKKNLLRLLDAYAAYVRSTPEPWHLVLLGDGPQKDVIVEKISALGLAGYVTLPGFLQYGAIPEYYGLAKAFVHASTSEQWGLVVNEAMAAGLPVLVSGRCGCCEDLVEDGRNGFSFDPYQTGEITEKLQALGSKTPGELAAMGAESLRKVTAFDPEVFGNNAAILVQKTQGSSPRPKPLLGRLVLQAVLHMG